MAEADDETEAGAGSPRTGEATSSSRRRGTMVQGEAGGRREGGPSLRTRVRGDGSGGGGGGGGWGGGDRGDAHRWDSPRASIGGHGGASEREAVCLILGNPALPARPLHTPPDRHDATFIAVMHTHAEPGLR